MSIRTKAGTNCAGTTCKKWKYSNNSLIFQKHLIWYVSAVMFKFDSILCKGLYDTSSQIPHRENVRFFITDSWLDYMYILQLVRPWRIIYGLIGHKYIIALGARRKQCLFNVGDLNGWELNKYHKRWNVNHLFHTHLVCLIMQGVTTEIVLTGWWPSFTLPRRFFYNRI
mgnify:FL=1